jgi:predicted helicase
MPFPSQRAQEAQARVDGHRFGLAIFDEAHKTASDTEGLFATALHERNIRIARRLFLTATPRVRSLRKGRDGDSVNALLMDDESIYGRCAPFLSSLA